MLLMRVEMSGVEDMKKGRAGSGGKKWFILTSTS